VQAAEHNRPANLFLKARIDIRMNGALPLLLCYILNRPDVVAADPAGLKRALFAANAASRKRGVCRECGKPQARCCRPSHGEVPSCISLSASRTGS
jgi:hypothetical protein